MSKTGFSIASLVLLSISLGFPQPARFNKIKVGMTYEEVEKLVGKPEELTRGFNELASSNSLSEYSLEELEALRKAADTLTSPNTWLLMKNVSNKGALLYVCWIYPEKKKERYRVLVPNSTVFYEPETSFTQVYFLGDREVGEAQYAMAEDTTLKRTAWKLKYIFENERKTSVTLKQEVCYVVLRRCILFDASSGRVVRSGFYPMTIQNEAIGR